MTRDDLISVHNGKAQLYLHPGQTKAWDSERRFVFVVAGTQGGKTSFGPWWLWREIKSRGSGDYLAVTATYDLFKLKMLPEMQRVFCELLPGWSWSASDRVILSSDGQTRIILRSANAPGGLESATAKAAWLDECGQDDFRLESWEAVLRRLSLARGRVLGTTTPYNLGWLKTEVYDRWRAGDPDYMVVQFKSIQNPRFPREEYERAKASLPAWKFEMFYNGQFSRPAGLIYEDFSEAENICDPFDIPVSWPRRVGVDFGGVHTATVWTAENPVTGAVYLFRETLEGGQTTREHAAKWLKYGDHVVLWMGGAPSEDQPRRDFKSAGVPIARPPVSDVEAGIDRVTALIKSRRLIVFRSCRGVLDELGTYSRELDDTGQPTEKIKDKETFHRLDALRYVACGLTQTVRAATTMRR
jgi:hypothetical protein